MSVAAYAYEMMDDPIMSDAAYDELSKLIDLSVDTGNEEMDNFFRTEFADYTGSWVRKHPDQARLHDLYVMKLNYLRNKEANK